MKQENASQARGIDARRRFISSGGTSSTWVEIVQTCPDVSGATMAAAFAAALPRMKKALRRFEVPFIATVTVGGAVTLMHDADGPTIPPKRVK